MSIRVYIDGQVCEPGKATVSVFDRGFLFGDSVYETVALLDRRLIFLEEHLDRLERSAKRIYLELPRRAIIEDAMRKTTASMADPDARVRVVVTRGVGPLDIDPATAHAPTLLVFAQPLGAPTEEMIDRGVAVALVHVSRGGHGSLDPSIKSGNYLSSVLAIGEARRRYPKANEAILCAPNGSVAEGATSNLFAVERGEVLTPACEVGILDGVTRCKVLALARQVGLLAHELPSFPPARFLAADEIFLTSAVRGILPVTTVDGAPVGSGRPGPVTRQLREQYQRLVGEFR